MKKSSLRWLAAALLAGTALVQEGKAVVVRAAPPPPPRSTTAMYRAPHRGNGVDSGLLPVARGPVPMDGRSMGVSASPRSYLDPAGLAPWTRRLCVRPWPLALGHRPLRRMTPCSRALDYDQPMGEKHTLPRREVLAAAGTALTASMFTGQVKGANDRISIAFIGVGTMGSVQSVVCHAGARTAARRHLRCLPTSS